MLESVKLRNTFLLGRGGIKSAEMRQSGRRLRDKDPHNAPTTTTPPSAPEAVRVYLCSRKGSLDTVDVSRSTSIIFFAYSDLRHQRIYGKSAFINESASAQEYNHSYITRT